MATPPKFEDRESLRLQVSLMLCQAIESDDPLGVLRDNVSFHNLSEFHLQSTGPARFLLAKTDETAEVSQECKLNFPAIREPAVYVAFQNAVGDLTGFAPNSLANFYQGNGSWGQDFDADGVELQGLVLRVIEHVPIQSLFSFLGQGYHVVFCGLKFGGMLAHAMAVRLLLHLRKEIQLAQAAGINLSALSLTEDKVVSFAFGAPYFANDALQRVLHSHNLDTNLNTMWKPGDAAPCFLTACSQLFCRAQQAAGLSNAARGATEEDSLGLPSLEPVPYDAALVRAAEFASINKWAEQVNSQVAGMSCVRGAALSCAPLDMADLLARAGQGQGSSHGVGPGGDELDAARSSPSVPAMDRKSAGAAVPVVGSPVKLANKLAVAAGRVAAGAAGPPASRPSRSNLATSILNSAANSNAASAMRPSSDGSLSPAVVRRSISGLPAPKSGSSVGASASKTAATGSTAVGASRTSISKAAAGSSASSAAPHKPVEQHSNKRALLTALSTSKKGITGAGGSETASTPRAPWRDALRDLLQHLERVRSDNTVYSPVGRFWLVEDKRDAKSPAASPKQGAKAGDSASYMQDNVKLSLLAINKVNPTCESYLTPENPNLFARWEFMLEDYKKDLMEAFAWVTFKTKADGGNGAIVDRSHLLRPLPYLD